MDVGAVDERLFGPETAQPPRNVRARDDEPRDPREVLRPFVAPPEDLRAVRVGRRTAREPGDEIGGVLHPHDLGLAACVEPRVEVRGGLETLVDRADPGHLTRERDAGDVGGPSGSLERRADRPASRRFDLVEILLDLARRRRAERNLLEMVSEDPALLVQDGGLRPHRAEVAADEDGHQFRR
jgi:hypothetical protein